MRAREFITELLDRVYTYSWSAADDLGWAGDFNTTNGKVHVSIEPGFGCWTAFFSLNGTYDVTGTGDQYGVLATFSAMLKEFILEKHPNRVRLSANKGNPEKEPVRAGSRAQLYQRLFQRLASSVGYTLKSQSFNDGEIVVFDLINQDNINESLDQPYPINWDVKTNRMWRGQYPGGTIEFKDCGGWSIDFTNSKHSHRMTNAGDQQRVMATVLKGIKEFVNTIRPVDFGFLAFKDSEEHTGREKLYTAMAKKYMYQLGYILEKETSSSTGSIYFHFTRNEQLTELNIDPVKGIGNVPYNQEVEYHGVKVMMKPSVFLNLASKFDSLSGNKEKIEKMAEYIRDGGAVAPPFLSIQFQEKTPTRKDPNPYPPYDFTKPPVVTGHEGRHRMCAIQLAEGDEPVEVHLFFHQVKRRGLNKELLDKMNQKMWSQNDALLKGPFFTLVSQVDENKLKPNQKVKLQFESIDLKTTVELSNYMSEKANYLHRNKLISDDCYHGLGIFEGFGMPQRKFNTGLRRLVEGRNDAERAEIQAVIDHIEQSNSVKEIAIGDILAVLSFEIAYPYREITWSGFTDTKRITAIYLSKSSGKILRIEFEDGSTYPRYSNATFRGQPTEHVAYYDSKESASKTLTYLNLMLPVGWELHHSLDNTSGEDLEGLYQKKIDEEVIARYPLAPKGTWYGEENYKEMGSKMVQMSPDEFLSHARPLTMDDESIENIDILKQHILDGKKLDPLSLYPNGKEDGRHRAYACKALGIKSVPVIIHRGSK